MSIKNTKAYIFFEKKISLTGYCTMTEPIIIIASGVVIFPSIFNGFKIISGIEKLVR